MQYSVKKFLQPLTKQYLYVIFTGSREIRDFLSRNKNRVFLIILTVPAVCRDFRSSLKTGERKMKNPGKLVKYS